MPYEFIKVHRSFFTGTMHTEAAYTKVLFLAMLLECTDGVIVATNDYLCRFANLKPEAVERALDALQQPDPQSTSPELDGRRIVAVDGARNTYRIVNWARYQPALSSDARGRPNIVVVDPDTGERVERLLPNGERNPVYQRLYQRLYRRHLQEQDAAAAALAAELGTIGVNGVNTLSGHSHGPAEGGGAKACADAAGTTDEPGSLDRSVNSVNSVNKRKRNKINQQPPKSPPRRPPGSLKALATGDPENAGTWDRFDKAYPRPMNGRKLERSEARATWDLLAGSGQDMEAVVAGALRYAEWVKRLGKGDYVCMMTTWLNGRRWEESWEIDPESAEARAAASKAAERLEQAREAHRQKHAKAFQAHLSRLAEDGSSDPEFERRWEEGMMAKIDRLESRGQVKAAGMTRQTLLDPQSRRAAMRDKWLEENQGSLPAFWEWDSEANPEPFGGDD